jgi:hypothetical protein
MRAGPSRAPITARQAVALHPVPRLIAFARSEHRPDMYGAAEYCDMGALRGVPSCGNSVEDLANVETFGNHGCPKSPL